MKNLKRIFALILVLGIVFCISGCKKGKTIYYETPDTVSMSNNSSHTGAAGSTKTEEEAKELISNYIYINALPYTIYADQEGKINDSIKKDGYFYFAVSEASGADLKQCEKSFAVKKKDSTIWAVNNKNGKMTLAFKDELFGN